jgi:hypothetical protein
VGPAGLEPATTDYESVLAPNPLLAVIGHRSRFSWLEHRFRLPSLTAVDRGFPLQCGPGVDQAWTGTGGKSPSALRRLAAHATQGHQPQEAEHGAVALRKSW